MIARRLGLPLVAVACLAAGPAALAVAPRASLTDIESRVMCTTCGVPLSIAESPQADRERAYIRGLIAQGKTTAEIEQALVGQLGPQVLALPPSRGFDLAAYVVPVGLIGLLAVMLAVGLPRWRRRGRAADGVASPVVELTDAEAARLDAELGRFRG